MIGNRFNVLMESRDRDRGAEKPKISFPRPTPALAGEPQIRKFKKKELNHDDGVIATLNSYLGMCCCVCVLRAV
jgi:hypothetical protein